METVTLAERPELVDKLWKFPGTWSTFMLQDRTSDLYYDTCVRLFPEFVMLALDGDRAVARSFCVPLAWDGDPASGLPAEGWDWAIRQGVQTRLTGDEPTLVSALEITVQVDQRGKGLSRLMLDAMRSNVAALGFSELVAPVRPNGKPAYPDESMESYLKRTTDGLPDDPWLRVHVRAGGTIVNVAPLSMHISGTLEQWREWTGLPFDTRGPIEVPDALVPVLCEPEHGYATYVEPNVWVLHRVGDQPRARSAKRRRLAAGEVGEA